MVVGLDSKQLKRDLASLTASSDVAVIDTAPRLDAGARLAMSEADLVLLPTTPGAADVWALQQTLELFEQVGTPGGVVLNRTDRTALSRAALKALEGYDVEVIGRLGSRVAFGEAILAGLGVVQNAPSSIAADEARKLTKAVIGALHAKKD
jgi:cellulose biosynthesis protein BcsQ